MNVIFICILSPIFRHSLHYAMILGRLLCAFGFQNYGVCIRGGGIIIMLPLYFSHIWVKTRYLAKPLFFSLSLSHPFFSSSCSSFWFFFFFCIIIIILLLLVILRCFCCCCCFAAAFVCFYTKCHTLSLFCVLIVLHILRRIAKCFWPIQLGKILNKCYTLLSWSQRVFCLDCNLSRSAGRGGWKENVIGCLARWRVWLINQCLLHNATIRRSSRV